MQSLYYIHYIPNRRDSLREASDFNNGAEPCRPQSANPQSRKPARTRAEAGLSFEGFAQGSCNGGVILALSPGGGLVLQV
jgi:hypothetical protein